MLRIQFLLVFTDLLDDYVFLILYTIVYVDQHVLILLLDEWIIESCSNHSDRCWISTELLKHIVMCQDFCDQIFSKEPLSHLFLDFILMFLYCCSVEILQLGQVLLEWKVLIFKQEVNDVA